MKWRGYYLLIGIGFIILWCMRGDTAHTFDQMMGWCAAPLLHVTHWLVGPFDRWKMHRVTVHELEQRIVQMQQEKQQLEAELIALRGIEIHALQRDDLVRWSRRYQTEYMCPAHVIGRLCSDVSQQLFLDVGSSDGIRESMIVVVHNMLIGRISAVYPRWCRVTTIADRTSKIPIICAQTKTRAIYEGLNIPDRARLSFVSHLHPLEKEDLLLSSGDGFLYPQGFAVGRIREFVLDSRGLHYEVTVEPLIDITKIADCYVITKDSILLQDDTEEPLVIVSLGTFYEAGTHH